MEIILFRHGEKQEKPDNQNVETQRSICMSAKGIEQIEKLGNYLSTHHPDFMGLEYIYSSPFPRTIQSAEIVRRTLGIGEVKPGIIFKEFYGFKDYSIPKEKRKEMSQYAFDHLDFVNESGYSYRQKINDIVQFISKQWVEGTKNLIISSHGALIRSMVLTIDQDYYNQYMQNVMSEGSYVLLTYDGISFKVTLRKHLEMELAGN